MNTELNNKSWIWIFIYKTKHTIYFDDNDGGGNDDDDANPFIQLAS